MLKAKGFDWDKGNLDKNWLKHGVSPYECEQVFMNKPLLLFPDEKHSDLEERFFVLGITNNGRGLFIVFTVRNENIRVISARDMSKKEKQIYGD